MSQHPIHPHPGIPERTMSEERLKELEGMVERNMDHILRREQAVPELIASVREARETLKKVGSAIYHNKRCGLADRYNALNPPACICGTDRVEDEILRVLGDER